MCIYVCILDICNLFICTYTYTYMYIYVFDVHVHVSSNKYSAATMAPCFGGPLGHQDQRLGPARTAAEHRRQQPGALGPRRGGGWGSGSPIALK